MPIPLGYHYLDFLHRRRSQTCTHEHTYYAKIDRYCVYIMACTDDKMGATCFLSISRNEGEDTGMYSSIVLVHSWPRFCRNIVRLQVGIKLKFNGFSNCHGRRVICEGGGEEDLWEALKKIEINIWREGGGLMGY